MYRSGKRTYYSICPFCGGTLDPSESCSCRQEREAEEEQMEKMFKTEGGGQYCLCLNAE